MHTSLPQQRNSRKAKEDSSWYIPTMEYWISSATSQDRSKVANALKHANGEVNVRDYIKALLPFSKDDTINLDELLKKVPSEIVDGDFITPIKEKSIADYINLPYKPQVMVNNPDAAMKRDIELKQALSAMYEQIYINMLNESLKSQGDEESGMPSKPIPDIKEFAEKFVKDWTDDKAIKAHNLLNLISQELNFETLRYEAFAYWWSCEEFYTFRYIRGNKICTDLINPLHAYPCSNGERFVEDYDAFVIKDSISWGFFKDTYYDFLSKENKLLVDKTINNGTLSDSDVYSFPITDLTGRLDHNIIKQIHGDRYDIFMRSNKTIARTIVIFKTDVKVFTLYRYNSVGELDTIEVPDGYVLDPLAGDISIVKTWRQEVYVGYRFGSAASSIYIPPVPNPVQQYDKDTNRCKLPVGGKQGILSGFPTKPIPSRIAVNLALDRFYQYIIDKEVAKYKAYMEVIPKSAFTEDSMGTVKEKYLYRLLDNTIIYDETKINPQEMNVAYRIVGNPGLERYLEILLKLKETNKAEAFSYSHMNPDRFGEIDTRSAVTNVNNNILRAKLGMILMVYMFNQTMLREHVAQLEYAKVAYSKGKSGHFNDSQGVPTFVNIDPDEVINSNYVLFIENSMKAEEKLMLYKNLAQALGQNNDPDLSAIAIDSDNVVEIRKKIEEVSAARREFEQNQAQASEQTRLQAAEIAKQIKEADNNIKLTIAQLHEENENYRTQLKVSENSSSNPIKELESKLNKLMLDRENLALKQAQLNELMNNNRETNSIKRDQIKSNERIAAKKASQRSK